MHDAIPLGGRIQQNHGSWEATKIMVINGKMEPGPTVVVVGSLDDAFRATCALSQSRKKWHPGGFK